MRLLTFLHLGALVLVTEAAPLPDTNTHCNSLNEHVHHLSAFITNTTAAAYTTDSYTTTTAVYSTTAYTTTAYTTAAYTTPTTPTTPTTNTNTTAAAHVLGLEERGTAKKKTKPTGKKQPPTASPTGPEYDLMPAIKAFDMPHKLKYSKDSKATNNLKGTAIKRSGMPNNVKFARGHFDPTIAFKDKKIFRTTNARLYQDAKIGLESGRASKKVTAANAQSGERALETLMVGVLTSTVNKIIGAVTGSLTKYHWNQADGSKAPITDLQLRSDGKTLAVIEVKTPNAFGPEVAKEIMDNLTKFRVLQLPETLPDDDDDDDDETTPPPPPSLYPSLVGADSPKSRSTRRKSAIVLEQAVAEMYHLKTNLGAITDNNDWLILERTGNNFTVTSLQGRPEGKRSQSLKIMLAMTFKAAGQKIRLLHYKQGKTASH